MHSSTLYMTKNSILLFIIYWNTYIANVPQKRIMVSGAATNDLCYQELPPAYDDDHAVIVIVSIISPPPTQQSVSLVDH